MSQERKKYNMLSTLGDGVYEKTFIWDEDANENYRRVVRLVRRESLLTIEQTLVNLIWGQLTGKILLREEET